jgi:hypothetical protein
VPKDFHVEFLVANGCRYLCAAAAALGEVVSRVMDNQ